jgi:FkbM family methyltransferase
MRPAAIVKPEYFYRPLQLLRRLRAGRSSDGRVVRVRLPGGAEFDARGDDEVGRALLSLGVFDLVVTEALFRLTDPGEIAIDAGANVGYMTGILASRVGDGGAAGTIHSFEPHPQLFSELSANVSLFKAHAVNVDFRLNAVALSDRTGSVALEPFAASSVNRGTSHVVDGGEGTIAVKAVTLDESLAGATAIGVMKTDVEGHELAVLRGASGLLRQRRIRDIVFEEHQPYPSDVTRFLESNEFEVFRLHRRFAGPRLLPPDSRLPRSTWEATSFLATIDAARAQERFRPRGWCCLAS